MGQEERMPTWKDIEEGSLGHPVILNDGGLLAMLVSKQALKLAGITDTRLKEEGIMFGLKTAARPACLPISGSGSGGRATYHLQDGRWMNA